MVNCGAGTAQLSGGSVGEGAFGASWLGVSPGQIPQHQWSSPWIKGTLTGLTGSGAAGGLQLHAQCGELSVALSLTHQLLVSVLTKPHMLLAVFFSKHLAPLNVCYKCL